MTTNGDLILKVLNKELTLSEAFRQAQENVFDYFKTLELDNFCCADDLIFDARKDFFSE